MTLYRQLCIFTEVLPDTYATISIAYNGLEIPEAVKQRLFDFFFTTKAIGKNIGMGCSISYQIISDRYKGANVITIFLLPG